MADVPEDVREKHPFHRPKWVVKQEGSPTRRIHASYVSAKEWAMDPAGYHIIKVFYDRHEIGVRFFTNDHAPVAEISGQDAESVMQTIVREKMVSSLQHAAYLGHELHKAEVALKLRLNFVFRAGEGDAYD